MISTWCRLHAKRYSWKIVLRLFIVRLKWYISHTRTSDLLRSWSLMNGVISNRSPVLKHSPDLKLVKVWRVDKEEVWLTPAYVWRSYISCTFSSLSRFHLYLVMPYNSSNRTLFEMKSQTARYSWAAWSLFASTASFIGDTIILVASIKYKAFKLHNVIVTIIQRQHTAVCDLMLSVITVLRIIAVVEGNDKIFGVGLCSAKGYFSAFFFSQLALSWSVQ